MLPGKAAERYIRLKTSALGKETNGFRREKARAPLGPRVQSRAGAQGPSECILATQHPRRTAEHSRIGLRAETSIVSAFLPGGGLDATAYPLISANPEALFCELAVERF